MIRRLQEVDADAVAALDGLLFPDVCWNEYTVKREARLGWALVVEEKSAIVGYLIARFDNDLTDIIRVGIHPDWQRKGLGRALLRDAIERVAGMLMLTVRMDNERAVKLYTSEGFKPVSQFEGNVILVRDPS